MSLHCMIDLETMSTLPNASILTLGAVLFNPKGTTIEKTLYLKIDIDEQDRMNRDVDENTLNWWSRQNKNVMEEAFSEDGRVSVESALEQLTKFTRGCKAYWSHGSVFDIIILDDLYRQMKKFSPWKYWEVRDTRTLFDIGFDPNMNRDGLHNALEDAKRQAHAVQHVYHQLEKLKNNKDVDNT